MKIVDKMLNFAGLKEEMKRKASRSGKNSAWRRKKKRDSNQHAFPAPNTGDCRGTAFL